MRNTVFWTLAGVVLPIVAMAQMAPKIDETCLNYWVVGDSGCNGKSVSKTAQVSQTVPVATQATPAPAAPTPQITAPTLDEKIDDFMENHGKPPREFVAFHLEPTLENALKWVYKYKDMLKRNIELTRAWMQAEAIYEQANPESQAIVADGVKLNPQVPDFGINVEGMPSLEQFAQSSPLASPLPGVMTSATPQPTMPTNPFASTQAVENGRIGGGGTVEIDYYFSAECPYCEKFEPEFKQALSQIEFPVRVTCVDLTPSGQTASNIAGKIDCDWRPAGAAEMQRMGIRTTPSLIINRGQGQPLERISGYVSGEKLLEHLLKTGDL